MPHHLLLALREVALRGQDVHSVAGDDPCQKEDEHDNSQRLAQRLRQVKADFDQLFHDAGSSRGAGWRTWRKGSSCWRMFSPSKERLTVRTMIDSTGARIACGATSM